MRHSYFLFILTLLCISCGNNEIEITEEEDKTTGTDSSDLNEETLLEENLVDGTSLPERMVTQKEMILGQADGDLDKDGIAEKVVVYSRDLEWESSAPRDLIIYKQKDGGWDEWIVTENAILRADEGGMMGDPFGEVQIMNGLLHISHYGGSSWKWGHTDKFRYQDGAFYLIGYTSHSGKPCEYWEDFDFNLSTGDCDYKFEVDDGEGCEDYDARAEYGPDRYEKFNHKMNQLPKLNNRRTFEYNFKSPKGEELYL